MRSLNSSILPKRKQKRKVEKKKKKKKLLEINLEDEVDLKRHPRVNTAQHGS